MVEYSKLLMLIVVEIAEGYSESCQTSNGYKGEFKSLQISEIELFPQVVASHRDEFRILPNIQDGAFCENS